MKKLFRGIFLIGLAIEEYNHNINIIIILMENLNTGWKHRDAMLQVILQCEGMAIQTIAELIEEYNLDITHAVTSAKEDHSGLSFKTLITNLLFQAYFQLFRNLHTLYDLAGDVDMDAINFLEYIELKIGIIDGDIKTKKELAIQNGWPKDFVECLSEELGGV